MRILHVVPSYLPAYRYGGPIHSVHNLCRALHEMGHEVDVFTTNIDGKHNTDVQLGYPQEINGVNVWYFSSPYLRRLYFSPAMKQHAQKVIDCYDVVHIHTVYLWPTTMMAGLARKRGIPYVLSPRGMLVADMINARSRWVKKMWISLFEKDTINNASAIHVTAELEKQELGKLGFYAASVNVIPNGVSVNSESVENDFSDDVGSVTGQGEYCLFLGRISWKKGIDRLLQAWVDMDIKLVIAGNDDEGYANHVKSVICEYGLDDRVFLIDRYINETDRNHLYSHAKLFLLLSYSENFGNTVLEAMWHKLPVVVTPEVGAAEIVRQHGCGLVVNDQAEGIAHEVKRILADEKLLKNMSLAGKHAVEKYYAWHRVAEDMAGLYTAVVDRAHVRGRQPVMKEAGK